MLPHVAAYRHRCYYCARLLQHGTDITTVVVPPTAMAMNIDQRCRSDGHGLISLTMYQAAVHRRYQAAIVGITINACHDMTGVRYSTTAL